jgi:hypothetical protein
VSKRRRGPTEPRFVRSATNSDRSPFATAQLLFGVINERIESEKFQKEEPKVRTPTRENRPRRFIRGAQGD